MAGGLLERGKLIQLKIQELYLFFIMAIAEICYMKTLGLIGGTSWVSTVDYYKHINQMVNHRLGGLYSAKLLLHSVNFEEFIPPSDPLLWNELAQRYIRISNHLISAGAECIMLCANTTHMAADEISKNIQVPLIHIADATAQEVKRAGPRVVGLIGTRITMEQTFFTGRLIANGIRPLVPGPGDRDYIDQTIFSELTKNVFKPETKRRYLEIIGRLMDQGAEAIIYACTEIPILIKPGESPLPSFDTMSIHAKAAVEFALGE